MINEKEFEDLRLGDKVKCMLHQKVTNPLKLIPNMEYKEYLSCGCPFTRLVIVEKQRLKQKGGDNERLVK